MTVAAPRPHDLNDGSMGTRGQLEGMPAELFRNMKGRLELDIDNNRVVVRGAPGQRSRARQVVFVP